MLIFICFVYIGETLFGQIHSKKSKNLIQDENYFLECSNKLNSMIMFICPAFDMKHVFGENLVCKTIIFYVR